MKPLSERLAESWKRWTRFYGKRIRLASLENGQVNKDTEDNIKRRLIAALLQFRDECQKSPELKNEYDYIKETLRLKKENNELKKEVAFLKKAPAFFAKEID